MVFQNRREAGKKLVGEIRKDKKLIGNLQSCVVVSLLRGGIIVGDVVAKELSIPNYPLVVAKIPAPFPHSPELAIGALCGDIVYRDEEVLTAINSSRNDIDKQVKKAKEKQKKYLQRFELTKLDYAKNLRGKTVLLVDDGIATGSTVRAAALFVKSVGAKTVILAVPVAPTDFAKKGFDRVIILHQDSMFFAVGQFYRDFYEIEDNEVQDIIKT